MELELKMELGLKWGCRFLGGFGDGIDVFFVFNWGFGVDGWWGYRWNGRFAIVV